MNLPSNNTFYVHTENNNNDIYVLTEAANKVFNNEKKKVVDTEQNEKITTEHNLTSETKIYEKVKIKDKLIDNYVN